MTNQQININLNISDLDIQIARLLNILNMENIYLKQWNIEEIISLEHEKNKILSDFKHFDNSVIKNIQKNFELLPRIKENILSIQHLAKENATLTLKMIDINKKIISIFIDQSTKKEELSYDKKGLKIYNNIYSNLSNMA